MPLMITAYQPNPCTVHFVGNQSLCEVLEYAKPTAYFHTSPSEWDKLRQEAEETVANAKPPSLDLGSNLQLWSQLIGIQAYNQNAPQLNPVPLFLSSAENLCLKPLKESLSLQQCKVLMMGPNSTENVDWEFWSRLGLRLHQVYASPGCLPVTMTRAYYRAMGTVGPQLRGVELRTDDKGNIYSRGRNVPMGVLNDAEATQATIGADGWMTLSDLGRLDSNGCLCLL